MQSYLFVYGTLLKDIKTEMSQFLKDQAICVEKAFVYGQLFDLGSYPGLILTDNTNDTVFGNLIKLKNEDKVLKALDFYEGVGFEFEQPNEYKRLKTTVYLNNLPTVNAWIYVYNHSLDKGIKITSGNYLEYCLSR